MNWEISIPIYHDPGTFMERGSFDSREEALKIATKIWGADSNGSINIVNEIHDEEDDFDDYDIDPDDFDE